MGSARVARNTTPLSPATACLLTDSLQLNVLISPDPDYCHQLTLPEQTLKSASETRLYQLAPPKGQRYPCLQLASMGTIHHSPPGAFVCTPNPGHRTVSVPEQTSSCKCEGVPSSEDTGINTYESPADPAYSCQHTNMDTPPTQTENEINIYS